MHSIINRLRSLADEELLVLSEAIDIEIACREERMEEHPDSARLREAAIGKLSHQTRHQSAAGPSGGYEGCRAEAKVRRLTRNTA